MGLSRNEDILQSIVDGTQYTDPPKSRVEDLLLQVKEVIEEGGGGTGDYDDLENRPQVNGITLSGNKSAADLSLASLDANGKVPAAQLPSYVDDVINGYLYEGHFYEDSAHTTEITGESGKIYVDLETNKTYRWSGLAFVEISESLALGETASTAYAGDKGKANADAITAIKDGQTIDSFGDVETALAGKQNTILHGALDASGGVDGDLYLKTVSSDNMDVCGTPTANTGDGYEITTDVTAFGDYAPYEGFGNGIGFGKNGAGRATLIYHITSGKKYKPKSVSLCNNFDVVGGYLTSNSTVISGSMDGTNWTQLATITTLTDKDESITEPISTNVYYSYFKFEILANSGYPGIKNIVLVGESDSEEDNKIDDIFFKQDGKWLKDAFAKKSDLDAKQDKLTFDNAPTENSNNPVKSSGIFTALASKVNTENGKGLSTNDYSDTEKAQVATNASDIGSLKSGLTTLDDEINGDATTYPYADVITIPDAIPANLADCTVKIEPVQDLHGYDKPWVGGANKNKINIADKASSTSGDVTASCSNGVITLSGTASAQTTFSFPLGSDINLTPSLYKIAYNNTAASSYIAVKFCNDGSVIHSWTPNVVNRVISDWTAAEDETIDEIKIEIANGYPTNMTLSIVVMDKDGTDTSFSPYENICPITGHTEASVEVTDGDETTKTYTIALGDTIYGGTVDFNTGLMQVKNAKRVFDGTENWQIATSDPSAWFYVSNSDGVAQTNNIICNEFTAGTGVDKVWINFSQVHLHPNSDIIPSGYTAAGLAELKAWLANNNMEIVYPLATPTTSQLTPQQIQLLKGTNTLTASTGQISVTVNGVSGAIGAVQTQANATDAALAELAADIAEQLPDAPTTDGAYVLTVTVADGTPTYSWESAT